MPAEPKGEIMIYINAYTVQRCYGGPEEGGWWFDTGEPIESLELPDDATDNQIDAAKADLRGRHGWESPHSRYSVLGGLDFEIYVESHPAEIFPATWPHYE